MVLYNIFIIINTNPSVALQKSVDEAKKQKSGFGELFSNRGNIKAVIISCAMVAWQQLSGINVVLLYSEKIFLKTGVELSASVSTIIVGAVMLVAAGLTPTLAKITTMRMLLYISAIGMAITDVSTKCFNILTKSQHRLTLSEILFTLLLTYSFGQCTVYIIIYFL